MLLSIDPSIVKIGIAVLDGLAYKDSYTFTTESSEPMETRLEKIYHHFTLIQNKYKIQRFDNIIIEYPDDFARMGHRGILNIRPLQSLHVAIGVIYASLVDRHHGRIHFITVKDWKGRQKKTDTQKIVELYINKRLNTHESDATLMGMRWYKKQMLNIK